VNHVGFRAGYFIDYLRFTIGFEILRRLNITAKHSGVVVNFG